MDEDTVILDSATLGGSFTLRRASIMDQFKIGKRRREILQDFPDADENERSFAFMMASIDTLAESKPAGFSWETCRNIDAVMQLWGDYKEWENSFLDAESDRKDQEGVSGGE
jgi:hypothetical protein